MRVALAPVIALAACRQALGIPGSFDVGGIEVGGSVVGLRDATTPIVTIELNGEQPVMVTADGTFSFPLGVPTDATYEVTASNGCEVERGSGTVHHDPVRDVTVVCDGVRALDALQFSAPFALTPALDPAASDYTIDSSLINQQTSLTPILAYPDAAIDYATYDLAPLPAQGGIYGPIAVQDGKTLAIQTSHPAFGSRVYTATFHAVAPTQFGYGKADAAAAGEQFGGAVATDGDLLVIGAPDAVGDGNAAVGRAIVYRRSALAWTRDAVLVPPLATANGRFGASVAVSAGRIAIGQPGIGRVHLFTYDPVAHVWNGTFFVGNAGDEYGAAVALAGANVVVGAPGANSSAGAVFVVPTGFTLAAPSPHAGDRFGASVAATASRIAVGAPGESSAIPGDDTNTGYPGAGAVYTFVGATWTFEAYLKAAAPGAGDAFGTAIAIDPGGDLLAIGAPLEASDATGVDHDATNNRMPAAGAAYLFHRTTGWAQTSYVKASNTGVGDNFGRAVSVVGNVLAIGAPFEDSSTPGVGAAADELAPDAGAVYLFAIDAGHATEPSTYIKASNPGAGDFFGAAIALSREHFVVGAPLEDSAASGWNNNQGGGAYAAGAVYTFR